MRISDWSSDVCSSDLDVFCPRALLAGRRAAPFEEGHEGLQRVVAFLAPVEDQILRHPRLLLRDLVQRHDLAHVHDGGSEAARSEEHTSELQSLMRISYAVFCLKKKK